MKKENMDVICLSRGENVGLPICNKVLFFCEHPCGILPTQGRKGTTYGFTLMELLVVVLIIGILAAVAVPQYQKAVYKSRYAALKNLSESLAQAQTLFYLTNATYTENLDQLDIDLPIGQLDESIPPKYVWADNECSVFLAEDADNKLNIHCANTAISMGYVLTITPTQTNRNCYIYGSVDPADLPLQHQICQSETGRSRYTSGAANSIIGPYLRYQY